MQAPWAKGGGTAMPMAVRPVAAAGAGGGLRSMNSEEDKTRFSFRGWEFVGENKPILSTHDTDAWSKELEMTLPEMVFGGSHLTVSSQSLGSKFTFNARDSLKACGKDAGIQVSMAREWKKQAELDIPDAQPYDWTYSTPCRGTCTSLPDGQIVLPSPTDEKIDFESLKPRPGDEILWSADVHLYEDELHDNGDCSLLVRTRVTPNYFYILQRLFVRVDQVTFRMKETRLHHKFGTNFALRQFTERDQSYDAVAGQCSPKEIAEQILHDPNRLVEKLVVRFDETEKFELGRTEALPPTQGDIMAKTCLAEEKFKKKFGNIKPSAGALLQRQKKHETRYFDSGDAFSNKKDGPVAGADKEPQPEPVLVRMAEAGGGFGRTTSAPMQSPQPSVSEIEAQTAVAEEKFKKKFGNIKPSAGAILQRQKKHETRYFDSGDAFSNKKDGPVAGADKEPQPEPLNVLSTAAVVEGDVVVPVIQPSLNEIEAQSAVAEEKFKKKFGNIKPSAGALLQRQKKHETRYFDSGDAFSNKKDGPVAGADKEPQPEPVLVRMAEAGGGFGRATSAPMQSPQPSVSEIEAQSAVAEEKFKKKFGSIKPSAGALLQRQKKHETRYFDSGDAFGGAK